MARAALPLGLGIIGGILTLPFGGIGFSAGFAIGAAVGSVVAAVAFPPDTPDVRNVGPRMDEQRFMKSSHGIPIPRGFGTYRLAGNVIWTNGIEEVKTVTKEGGGKGGGGGSITTTTFDYFSSFAVAFGVSGPNQTPKLRKLYLDNKLFLDFSGTGKVERCDLEWRFYDGLSAQEPDPLMEAEEGILNVSAHRGLVYIMIERMAIRNFGNRIPQVQAEISFDGAFDPVETLDTAAQSYGTNRQWIGDFSRHRLYYYADDNPTPAHLDEWNMETSVLDGQATINEDLDSQNLKGLAMLPPGQRAGMILAAGRPTFNPKLFILNPHTGSVVDQTEITGSSTDIQYVTWMKTTVRVAEQVVVSGADGSQTTKTEITESIQTFAVTFQGAADDSMRARLVQPMPVDTAAISPYEDTFADTVALGLPGVCHSHTRISDNQVVFLFSTFGGGAGRPCSLLFVKFLTASIGFGTGGNIPLPPVLLQVWDFTDAQDLDSLIYLKDEHALVGVTRNIGGEAHFGDGGEGMAKWQLSGNSPGDYSLTLDQVVDHRTNPEYTTGDLVPPTDLHINMIQNETWWFNPRQTYLYLRNSGSDKISRLKVSGRMRLEKDYYDLGDIGWSNVAGMDAGFYNPITHSFHFVNGSLPTPDNRQVIYLDRIALGSTPLSDTVAAIAADVNVASADIDVTDLEPSSPICQRVVIWHSSINSSFP